jgi:uncharacterized protein YjgD (DUF1641 family)
MPKISKLYEEKLEEVREKLLEKLRENTTNEEFLEFAFQWFGEEFIMELLEKSINDYEDLDILKESLDKLNEGDYREINKN